ILKRSFAPRLDHGETKQLYLDLVYGYAFDDNSTDHSSSSISDDNSIPSGGAYQCWQYAHKQFYVNIIECLPSVNPEDQLGYAKMLLEWSYTEMKIALDLLDLNNFSGELASSSKTNNDDDDFFDQLKTTPRQALELIELDEK
ncbi:12520_t:CDS:2, partial [Cetraspora pellucida]